MAVGRRQKRARPANGARIATMTNRRDQMNLGIEGKTAIVCGASGGLGRACAVALAQEGVDVVLTARTPERLQAVAQVIRANSDVAVTTVACDITTVEARATLLSACACPDILVNNGGGPPFADYKDLSLQAWQDALNANMLAPIELIRQTIASMIERRYGRIVNVTSSAVKAPIDILSLSNGARMGLTGYVAGVARKVAVHNVTINNLLPSLISTERTTAMTGARAKRLVWITTASRPSRFPRYRRGASEHRRSSVPSALLSVANTRAT